jgi:hypothetical protein
MRRCFPLPGLTVRQAEGRRSKVRIASALLPRSAASAILERCSSTVRSHSSRRMGADWSGFRRSFLLCAQDNEGQLSLVVTTMERQCSINLPGYYVCAFHLSLKLWAASTTGGPLGATGQHDRSYKLNICGAIATSTHSSFYLFDCMLQVFNRGKRHGVADGDRCGTGGQFCPDP